MAGEGAAALSLGVLWGEGQGLGLRDEDFPTRVSDTHLSLQVYVGPRNPLVAGVVGDGGWERLQLPGH